MHVCMYVCNYAYVCMHAYVFMYAYHVCMHAFCLAHTGDTSWTLLRWQPIFFVIDAPMHFVGKSMIHRRNYAATVDSSPLYRRWKKPLNFEILLCVDITETCRWSIYGHVEGTADDSTLYRTCVFDISPTLRFLVTFVEWPPKSDPIFVVTKSALKSAKWDLGIIPLSHFYEKCPEIITNS